MNAAWFTSCSTMLTEWLSRKQNIPDLKGARLGNYTKWKINVWVTKLVWTRGKTMESIQCLIKDTWGIRLLRMNTFNPRKNHTFLLDQMFPAETQAYYQLPWHLDCTGTKEKRQQQWLHHGCSWSSQLQGSSNGRWGLPFSKAQAASRIHCTIRITIEAILEIICVIRRWCPELHNNVHGYAHNNMKLKVYDL